MFCRAFGNQPASPAESSSNLSQRKIRMRDSMFFFVLFVLFVLFALFSLFSLFALFAFILKLVVING
jgi:hypothetical protein